MHEGSAKQQQWHIILKKLFPQTIFANHELAGSQDYFHEPATTI